ncbi:MAG: ATP-dependent DNA helicase [Butyrivibrio sp.]|nr:ATP-dependent DNA helicase [Butyrivibrio sp.]
MDIQISIRGLVEFILRSGDIDNRIHQGPSDAMQEGSRIHRMIQKSMGPDYHAEVPLKYVHEAEGYNLVIEGRADGILDKYIDDDNAYDAQESFIESPKPNPMIDEIKGTYRELAKMKEPVPVHLAQAKCYAAIYSGMKHCPGINVRMSYCNIETEEMKYFDFSFSYKEITSWFKELVSKYLKWSDFEYNWAILRTSSIKAVQFPFSYREGQKELAAAVYRTIVHEKKLFLEAPTGTGKTITTVFPTVKAMGEGKLSKIFYLTAKTITRTVAEEAFDTLRSSQNLRFKTATITARDKICFLNEDDRNCNPEACPYAKGHFDRINNAMFDLLIHEESFDREKIVEYAEKHRVCPFEMSLDMSLFADGVICDYNYVFDPFVYLRRYFADGIGGKKDYAFLVDEAHNLLDRGRDMYSAILRKESFLELKSVIKEFHPSIAGHLDKCNKVLLEYKRQCDGCQVLTSIESIINPLNKLSGIISEYLENHQEGPCREEILLFYFDISRFLTIYDLCDDHYVIYSEFAENGDFIIKLFCADPSRNLASCMDKGKSSILFSATLLPIQYYKRLLGGTPEDFEIYAKSVFDPSKLGIFIGSDVTSKYSERSDDQYLRIAGYIDSVTKARSGNYLIFFPSHQFLEEVYYAYGENFYDEEKTELLVQQDYMSEEARESFLDRFSVGNNMDLSEIIHMDLEIEEDKNVLGFCVMGGIFSEGIDLKYDSLIGVIVVGTGIPLVCNEREILRSFFEQEEVDGFDYAYRYPGMNKVLQAAGRVIRTEEDEGVAVLLDNRFLQNSYKSLFPREWRGYKTISTQTVKNLTSQFWSERERK